MVSFLSGTPKMSSGTIKRLSGHKPMIDVDLLDEPGDRYWINWIYRIPTVVGFYGAESTECRFFWSQKKPGKILL